MIIAELTEHDLESLSALYEQFWGETSSLEKMRDTFRSLENDPHYIFLGARQGDQLAGSVMGIVCEELYGRCQPFMVIEDVIVDKGSRRRGVGKRLMLELERRAVDRGCTYIIFVTEQARDEAVRFYQSLGYDPEKYRGFKKRLE